ncbi:MAG: DUF1707 SHOCT-like domain-containing protein [Solirubrobacteraceae bacterium]
MSDNDLWGWVYTTTNPGLRASDTDRERVAERLRASHADGRLDTTELTDRIDRCYHAKTIGQLDRLMTDLPRAVPTEPPGWRPRVWRIALVLAPVWIALAAISAVTGTHLIWLVLPIAFLARRIARTRHTSWGATNLGSPSWGART